MGNLNRYVSGMVLAAAIVVFGGFFFLRGAVKTTQEADFDMSYTMPRPKSALYNFFFGLEGREIERKEVDPFKAKREAAEKLAAKSAEAAKNAPKMNAQNPANKNAAKAAPQAASATKTNGQKKAEVKVNVVNSAPESSLNSGDLDSGNQLQSGGAQGIVYTANGAATDNAKEKIDLLSASQWRALVLGQPTKENVLKLVSAFNNKEVDVTTLYQIMGDLMQSSNSESQNLGLLIAQSVPSLKSFSAVSENYEKFDAGTKQAADTYLMTYMQNSRLSILAMALQAEDSQVVARAAQVMVAGLEQVKKGGKNSRQESGRGIVSSSTGNHSYSGFVGILQELTKNADGSIAALAQNALAQIQSLSNT